MMIEALNSMENGPCLLTTTAAAAAFIAQTGCENVRLQYDAYHMQRMEGDLTTTLDTYWSLISHIQIANVPGRGEPGTGEINYRFPLGHLDRKGYDGYVGLEYRPSDGLPRTLSAGWRTMGCVPALFPDRAYFRIAADFANSFAIYFVFARYRRERAMAASIAWPPRRNGLSPLPDRPLRAAGGWRARAGAVYLWRHR